VIGRDFACPFNMITYGFPSKFFATNRGLKPFRSHEKRMNTRRLE
jgi:hypothetical protein